MALTQIKLGGLAAESVDSDAYVDGSIDNAHLSADSVDSTQYVDASIDNAHLADDAADSDEFAAGAIDTAHIADNQVTLAKMAGGTDGNIISYDASGDPVAIATGSDGQVLTSTGAGSPPAFEAVAAAPVTALNNATVNEVVTVGSTTTELDAESGLIFDGESLGVGVTPESMQSDHAAIRLGLRGALLYNDTDNAMTVSNNLYRDATDSRWEFVTGGIKASDYYQHDGAHVFRAHNSTGLSANDAYDSLTLCTIHGNGRARFRSEDDEAFHWKSDTVNANDSVIRLYTDNAGTDTCHFIINGNGNVLNTNNSYTGTSDESLKTNISDANSQWDDIKSLKVKNFELKANVDASIDYPMIGVIAQEAEASGMSGLVVEVNSDGEGTMKKSFKYSILYMKAVKALQEAMERIESLESKVTALESA